MTVRKAVFLPLAGVFLVGLLTASGATASGLSAEGGGIEVVETKETVAFPGTVDLSVTAQGDAEIVAVRLFYRNAGSRIWAYAYPDFVPSNRITASLNLTGVGSSYLPPGALVEYYYEIMDSQGNVLRTEPTVVEYVDTRFDWEEITIGPLTLLYYGQPESRVRGVARSLRTDLARLQELLQIDQVSQIKGVIYSRRSDALAAFPQQSRTTTEQQTFQGFAFQGRNLFLGLGMHRGLIMHEAAHLLFGQALGERAPATPSWLAEGFASYMDPSSRVFSGKSLSSRTNPLRAMGAVTGTPHAINAFYQKSLSVVAFLIDDFGETDFQRFVAQMREGATVDASLTAVYGFDVDGLDALWAGEAPGAPAPAPSAPGQPPPGPGSGASDAILFFNSWLLGGLMIFVIAALSVQFLRSKLRPSPRLSEEDPDLWYDDPDGTDQYGRY